MKTDKPLTDDSVPGIWKSGDILLGAYEVRELLGEGGMGQVFKVYHRGWGQTMAVKCPRPGFFSHPGTREAFEREAETWVKLGIHANIVTCYFVRRMGGVPRVFCEFIDGGSLLDWIVGRDRQSPLLYEGQPEHIVRRILDIAIQMAWGLHFAHQKGLVHLDVKPANVLITKEGIVKISDFGLARGKAKAAGPIAPEGAATVIVSSGGFTPAYCSPEQDRRRWLSRKTDIWSWAVTVLHMFCGKVAWKRGPDAANALAAYLTRFSTLPNSLPIPPLLGRLLQKCFQEDSRNRPRDFSEIILALQEVYKHLVGAPYARPVPFQGEDVSGGLNNRAVSLLDLGMEPEAHEILEEALRAEPQHVESTYNLGLLQWRKGWINDLVLLSRIRETQLADPGVWLPQYLESVVHLERGDVEGSRSTLKRIKLAEPHQEVRNLSERLGTLTSKGRGFLYRCSGHSARVLSVCVSPDGKLAASAGVDRTIRIWDLATGELMFSLLGHEQRIEILCYCPDGRHIASGSADRTIRIWEIGSGTCVRILRGHLNGVQSLCFLDAGKMLFSGSSDESVKLWDWQAGRSIWTFEDNPGGVFALNLADQGQAFWAASGDGTLRCWETASRKLVHQWQGPPVGNTTACFRPDGNQVLLGCEDGAAEIWDTSQGKCLLILEGETQGICASHWTQSASHALTGSNDGTFKLWDVCTGRCLRSFDGISGRVRSLATDSGGGSVIVADQDSDVKVYRLRLDWDEPAPLMLSHTLPASQALAAGEENARLIVQSQFAVARGDYTEAARLLKRARSCTGFGRSKDSMEIWASLYAHLTRAELRAVWPQRTFSNHGAQVTSIAFCGTPFVTLSASEDETIKRRNLLTGERTTLEGHFGKVQALAVRSDGTFAVSAGQDESVRTWDLVAGKCVSILEGHSRDVSNVVMTPNGNYALSAGWDGDIRVWELQSARCVHIFQGHAGRVRALTVSPDGSFALSAGDDKTLRVWNLVTLREEEWSSAGETVHSICFPPNGNLVISTGASRDLKIWDWKSRSLLRTIASKAEYSTLVACPAGRFLLAAGDQGAVWDLQTGKCVWSFSGPGGRFQAAAFSPDARFVVTGNKQGKLGLWFLDWELAHATNAAIGTAEPGK